jgi:predicted dehydrogenase
VDIKPVNVGVLGYGHFFRTNFIKNMRGCRQINIVGVYNRGEERRLQAEQDGFWATSNLDELLARKDVEAVLIGTSNDAHCDNAIASAKAGKHIFCEKPLALHLEEIDRMIAATDKAGVLTHVNHGGPYTDAFEKCQSLAAERCGKIMQVWIRSSRQFGTWKMGARHFAVGNPQTSGGWTMHHFCHALNSACTMIREQPSRAYHVLGKSCLEAPSEELCTATITFADGSTALLNDGTTIGGFCDFGVIGTDGDLRQLGEEITLVTHGPFDPAGRPGNRSQVVEKFHVPEQGKMIPKVGRIFAEAVRSGDGGRLISFRQIRYEYKILAALCESARTGQAIEVK